MIKLVLPCLYIGNYEEVAAGENAGYQVPEENEIVETTIFLSPNTTVVVSADNDSESNLEVGDAHFKISLPYDVLKEYVEDEINRGV